ncbi:MAG: hypothetical protein QOG68_1348, partial [Solirubrobacteraceae bacterium]|nr:hypothetical protein [Solirubrobacteraceae bacterium]
MVRRLLAPGLVSLACLAAPGSAGAAHLFFTETNTPGIQRAETDGSSPQPLGSDTIGLIAADATSVYWVGSVSGQTTIGRMDLDGQNANPSWLTVAPSSGISQLAAGSGHVCWARAYNQGGNRSSITCVTVASDGAPGTPQVAYDSDVHFVNSGGLAVDDEYVYFPVFPAVNGPSGSIGRAHFDGSNTNENLVSNVNYARGVAVNSSKIFFSEWNAQSASPPVPAVYAYNKDGSGGRQVIAVLDQSDTITKVAANENYVYWIGSAPGTGFMRRIGRATTSGGEVNRALVTIATNEYQYLATEGGGGCKDTLDFHTSMIATGCFEDQGGGKWKAKGPFRVDGIDAKSVDDVAYPVIFDTNKKTIDADQVQISLSAPSWGSGWLANKIPEPIHLTFPTGTTSWTVPLTIAPIPSGAGVPFAFNALGFLQLSGLVSPTLFGYPAHAPYADFTMTPGASQATLQLSWPTSADAFVDPINGLWKVANGRGGSRVNYPTALKVVAHASNDSGVDHIEGTFSPANIYGIDPSKGKDKIVWGSAGAPAEGVIELAKVSLGWQLAKGIVDLGAVLVFHRTPWDRAAKALPKAFFLGRPVGNVNVALTWWRFPFGGQTYAAPLPTELKFGLNSLNEPIGSTSLFWQRIGFTGGYDLSKDDRPLHLGGSLGFSFLPRFKHDFLWFQEAASLDVTGDIAFNPVSVAGTGDLKLAGVNLLHGGFLWGPEGFLLEGSATMKLNALLKFGVPIETTGTMTYLWPDDSDWQVIGDMNTKLFGLSMKSTLVWNQDGMGFCMKAGRLRGQAYVFDGSWHWAGCDLGPFLRAASARVNLHAPHLGGGFAEGGKESAVKNEPIRFTVRPGSRLRSVAIRGRSASPKVSVTGPGGLSLTVRPGNPMATSGNATLVTNDVPRGDKTTYLMFASSARPGNYTVTPAAASPTITAMGFAQTLPAPHVSARTTVDRHCRRQLSWKTRKLPGQQVTFLEHTGLGPDHPVVTTAKARGRRRFTPVASTATNRTILARIE